MPEEDEWFYGADLRFEGRQERRGDALEPTNSRSRRKPPCALEESFGLPAGAGEAGPFVFFLVFAVAMGAGEENRRPYQFGSRGDDGRAGVFGRARYKNCATRRIGSWIADAGTRATSRERLMLAHNGRSATPPRRRSATRRALLQVPH